MREGSLILALVVPVYNEEKIIEEAANKWVFVLEGLSINYAVHIYNDGSRDKTGEVLSKLAQSNGAIFVHNQENRGHGPTILSGYRDNTTAEWIFQTDSDDEIDPAGFIELWKKRNEYDFLIGRRIDYANSMTRRIISAVSRVTIGLLYGRGVYDTNSPFRLMRSSCFKPFFEGIPSDTFAPNVIISGIAAWKKMRIFEMGVDYHFRKTGSVSIKHFKLFRAAIKSFVETLKFSLFLRTHFRRKI